MKKTILTTTCLITGAVGMLAQGVVNFDNNNNTYDNSIAYGGTIDYRIFQADGVTPITSTLWSAQLWEINQSGVAANVGTPAFFRGSTGSRPGTWTAGEKGPLSVKAGVETTLQVRIYNETGLEVVKGPTFAYKMGTTEPPGTGDTLMVNFRGFAVPEPSTVALGVLGLGALLLFRRRK